MRYNNDPDFSLKTKMGMALAFVPFDNMDDYLDPLAELQPLLNWFEDHYIGRQNRRGNGRRRVLFTPEVWNLYNRVLNEEDRTNHAEAAHQRLHSELGINHLTIWKLLMVCKKYKKDVIACCRKSTTVKASEISSSRRKNKKNRD